MSKKKKTFKMEFKQGDQWYELQDIPESRRAAAEKFVEIQNGEEINCDHTTCRKCPFDRRMYKDTSCLTTVNANATNIKILE